MTDKPIILVVDDEEGVRHNLNVLLERRGYRVLTASDVDEGIRLFEEERPDVALCDLVMPKKDGFEFLKQARAIDPTVPVIVITAYGSIESAVTAIRDLGAYDFLEKPIVIDKLAITLGHAIEFRQLKEENVKLRSEKGRTEKLLNMLSQNPRMHRLFESVRKIAPLKTTVLITGESGTGKELVARAIHELSPRKNAQFVAVNCGAIPETLLESELFGYKKGAFTGATSDKIGLFERAHAGTIFLDEIGELPLGLQVKLFRVLETSEFYRVGESQSRQVDVRMIAASAKNLEEEVASGRFREELFYRLNVFPIHLPPLRERPEDIPLLTEHFIGEFNSKLGCKVEGISPHAIRLLMAYGWPGNVRELENTIERAMILAESGVIEPKHFPERIRSCVSIEDERLSLTLKDNVKAFERQMIVEVLKKVGGNRTQAAKLLGISLRALLYKMKEYEVDV